MELKAKLVQLLEPQSGEGKNGTWKKQDFIVETDGQYPKKVCISAWGDKFNESILKVGNILTIQFDAESREYNTKWYTDLKAWKIELSGAANEESITREPQGEYKAQAGSQDPPFMDSLPDDLPF